MMDLWLGSRNSTRTCAAQRSGQRAHKKRTVTRTHLGDASTAAGAAQDVGHAGQHCAWPAPVKRPPPRRTPQAVPIGSLSLSPSLVACTAWRVSQPRSREAEEQPREKKGRARPLTRCAGPATHSNHARAPAGPARTAHHATREPASAPTQTKRRRRLQTAPLRVQQPAAHHDAQAEPL